MSKKRSFLEVGQWLQITAKTEDEAKERLESSCTLCNKGHLCKEMRCPIYKAYLTRLLILEYESKPHPPMQGVEVKTRTYTKHPDRRLKNAVLRYLDEKIQKAFYQDDVFLLEEVQFLVNDANYIEACRLLDRHRLFRIADKIQALVKKYQQEV